MCNRSPCAYGDGVVEVLCILAVDGEDWLAAQVKALCVFFVADGLVADALGFIEHFLRENMRNAVLLYNGVGADTRRAPLPKTFFTLAYAQSPR